MIGKMQDLVRLTLSNDGGTAEPLSVMPVPRHRWLPKCGIIRGSGTGSALVLWPDSSDPEDYPRDGGGIIGSRLVAGGNCAPGKLTSTLVGACSLEPIQFMQER